MRIINRWPYEQWEAKTDLGIPISPQSPMTKTTMPHNKANTIDLSTVCPSNHNHEMVQRRWSETSTDLLVSIKTLSLLESKTVKRDSSLNNLNNII